MGEKKKMEGKLNTRKLEMMSSPNLGYQTETISGVKAAGVGIGEGGEGATFSREERERIAKRDEHHEKKVKRVSVGWGEP